MGAAVGNIIATIMTTQIARNGTARMPIAGEAIVMCMVMLWAGHTRATHAAAASPRSKNDMILRSGSG